jgi:hypothetical protein
MVAFDIETLDKEPFPNAVTAAAVYGGPSFSKYFVFRTSVGDDPYADPEADEKAKAEFLSILDNAPCLCSFNGIQFDMRFMRVAWGLPAEQIEGWVLKTFDAFEVVRLGVQKYFSLSDFLKFNMIESKSGKGSDAIGLARRHEWEELGAYCLQDTKVTYILSTHDVIVVPLKYKNGTAMVLEKSNSSLFSLFS